MRPAERVGAGPIPLKSEADPPPPAHTSATLRRLAVFGARRGPKWFVRGAPAVLGLLFALVLPGARRAVVRNLRRIHGTRDPLVEALDVARTFGQFAAALTESLAGERDFFTQNRFRIRNRHRVDPILKAGRGALLVTAHVGPWDAAAMGLRQQGDLPVMMLMSHEPNGIAAGIQDELRKDARVEVVRVGQSSFDALPVLAHLEKGGLVVAQMDRTLKESRVIAGELFQAPFSVPRGLFQLAGLARVPIVPIFAARLGFARCLIEVGTPIVVTRRASSAELREAATDALRQLEAHLSAFPNQWFHFPSGPESG